MFRLEEMSGIIPEKVGEFGVNQRFFWAEKGLPFSGQIFQTVLTVSVAKAFFDAFCVFWNMNDMFWYFFFLPLLEEMIQFDEHIFQMGSINYLQTIWLNVWSISRSAGRLEWEEIREESESTRKESFRGVHK